MHWLGGNGVFCVVKQKTADEMRISDWSSDVCSSDLRCCRRRCCRRRAWRGTGPSDARQGEHDTSGRPSAPVFFRAKRKGRTLSPSTTSFLLIGAGHASGGVCCPPIGPCAGDRVASPPGASGGEFQNGKASGRER